MIRRLAEHEPRFFIHGIEDYEPAPQQLDPAVEDPGEREVFTERHEFCSIACVAEFADPLLRRGGFTMRGAGPWANDASRAAL